MCLLNEFIDKCCIHTFMFELKVSMDNMDNLYE